MFPKALLTLGDWIKFWRKHAGLTQRQLAAKVGLPKRRIEVIETDDAIPAQIEILAIERGLGIAEQVLTARCQQ